MDLSVSADITLGEELQGSVGVIDSVSSDISLPFVLQGIVDASLKVSARLTYAFSIQASSDFISTLGFLAPTRHSNSQQDAILLDVLHDWIAGVTGFEGDRVIPRWQQESNNPYDIDENWVSFGILWRRVDSRSSQDWEDIYYVLSRNEKLRIITCFYGDQADYYASRLRDGMQISQNLDFLRQNEMTIVKSNDIISVPEMIKYKWVYRQDLSFDIIRRVKYTYPIMNLIAVGKGEIYGSSE